MRTIKTSKQHLPPQTAFGLAQGLANMKNKKIFGLVTSIVDGNTFEISVHDENNGSSNNKHIEKIKIHGMNKPSASTLSGILAKLELEKKIVGRHVECEIIERDDSDQIIALVPKKYLKSPFSFDADLNP